MTKKYTRKVFFATLTLIVMGGVFAVVLFTNYPKRQTSSNISRDQTTTNSSRIYTGEGSYVIATNAPGQMKFISPKLGISFFYYGPNPKEVDNKVYFLPDGNYGYVKVFQKNPLVHLEVPIEQNILKGYSSADCYYKGILPSVYFDSGSMEIGFIDFPYSNEYGAGSTQRSVIALNKCPPAYTNTNIYGNYFVMDSNHPDKFAFIHVSRQSGITGKRLDYNKTTGEGYVIGWNQTLQFFK